MAKTLSVQLNVCMSCQSVVIVVGKNVCGQVYILGGHEWSEVEWLWNISNYPSTCNIDLLLLLLLHRLSVLAFMQMKFIRRQLLLITIVSTVT